LDAEVGCQRTDSILIFTQQVNMRRWCGQAISVKATPQFVCEIEQSERLDVCEPERCELAQGAIEILG
jgi:hypothetical protein